MISFSTDRRAFSCVQCLFHRQCLIFLKVRLKVKMIGERLDKSWENVGADRYNEDCVLKWCKKWDVRRCDPAYYDWQWPTENHHQAHLPNLQHTIVISAFCGLSSKKCQNTASTAGHAMDSISRPVSYCHEHMASWSISIWKRLVLRYGEKSFLKAFLSSWKQEIEDFQATKIK